MSDLFKDPLPVRLAVDTDPDGPEVLFDRPLPVVILNEGDGDVDDAKIAALINDETTQTHQAVKKMIEDHPNSLG